MQDFVEDEAVQKEFISVAQGRPGLQQLSKSVSTQMSFVLYLTTSCSHSCWGIFKPSPTSKGPNCPLLQWCPGLHCWCSVSDPTQDNESIWYANNCCMHVWAVQFWLNHDLQPTYTITSGRKGFYQEVSNKPEWFPADITFRAPTHRHGMQTLHLCTM